MATIIGGKGDNKIIGTKFADKLFGKGGNDIIKGDGAKDLINGGTGNDKLTGGKGEDWFSFGSKSGTDVINDFEVGKDVLEIKAGLNGITTTADALSKATQVGDNVVIDLGNGNTIKLKNVNLGDLTEDDFFIS